MAEIGTLMRQGLEGYDAGTDRVALEESRKIGLDDQKFQSQRRKTVAGREDTKYDRNEEQYQRSSKGKDVINNYMVNGDFGGVQDYLNDYTRDGADHYLKRNKNGSVDGILEIDGKQVKKNFKTDDELMQYVMMVSKNDPFAMLDEQRKAKAAGKAKAGERAHDLAKIDRKGSWDMSIAGLKEGGKGGKKATEAMRKIANDMEQRSKSRRGQMTALGNYDMAGISANLANYDGVLGVKLHQALGMDTNQAYTKAYDMVSKLHKTAEAQAIQQFPDDDVKQTEHIRAVLERGTAQIVASIDKKAQGTQSGKPQPGKQTKTTTKAPAYDQFLKDFKAKNEGSTDADAKRMYGEWFPTAKSEAKLETKPGLKEKTKTKAKGLAESGKKLSFKEEVELYRTPTRKPTKGFKSSSGGHRSDKAQEAANKAAKSFKRGIKLSEPELRLALNADANERTKRAIIKKIKEIKAKRKE